MMGVEKRRGLLGKARPWATAAWWAALAVGGGCSEYTVALQTCAEVDTDFELEEVSALESMQGAQSCARDAVVVTYDRSNLAPGDTWRVLTVDVLLMVDVVKGPTSLGNVPLTVEIFESSDPRTGRSWSVTQWIDPDALAWELVTLSYSGEDLEMYRAWWTFDFSEVIPKDGMDTVDYVAGVQWEELVDPLIGYSQFDRPCDRNWTIYNNEPNQWIFNGEWSTSSNCSWPMFRIQTERRFQAETCR